MDSGARIIMDSSIVKIGKLRHRITIEQAAETQDTDGFVLEQPVYDWAEENGYQIQIQTFYTERPPMGGSVNSMEFRIFVWKLQWQPGRLDLPSGPGSMKSVARYQRKADRPVIASPRMSVWMS